MIRVRVDFRRRGEGPVMAGERDIRDFVKRHGLESSAAEELRELVRATVKAALTPVDSGEDWTSRPRFQTIDPEATDELEVSVREASVREDRYEDRGLVGTGGMAEVRRVWDPELHRTTAMKVLWNEHNGDMASIARFVREARTTARLEHPGVVPVHEIGRLADGRWYFTMEEVRGRTLAEVITEVHRNSGDGTWGTGSNGWTFRRLIETFRMVCETVAFAHSRGVVHRDIKPNNIMVGEYGETLVLDWGLAKSVDDDDERSHDVLLDALAERAGADLLETPPGWVVGTPAYMPPELAKGTETVLAPTIDVYSLGALLYEILSGRVPYRGRDGREVLKKLVSGPPPEVDALWEGSGDDANEQAEPGDTLTVRRPSAPPPIPSELKRICATAMSRDIDARYANAKLMADAVTAWLEGAQRRDRALSYTTRADALRPEVRRLRNQASILAAEADRLLEALPPSASPTEKRAAWALEDTGERLQRDADLQEVELIRLAQSALTHHSGLPEARALLADHYRERHQEAESARDPAAAARFEALLKVYDTGRHADWLAGDGRLSLTTEPPGAMVELYRWVARERVLHRERVRKLGTTPLRAIQLPAGSYLLQISHPRRASVDVPVRIERCLHATRTPPKGHASGPIVLARRGELADGDVLVPAGWFLCGGDPDAPNALDGAKTWVDAFVMRRFPVTNEDYLEFLNALGEDAASRAVPRQRGARAGEVGDPVYEVVDGMYRLGVDADGDEWMPRWPVVFVDHTSAAEYASWYAAKTGEPWRLPSEYEWEKAARGVDGRFHPWGDRFDPTFCRMRRTVPGGHGMIAEIGEHPTDASAYGIRDLAGNVGEWCGGDGPLQVRRGGAWTFSPRGVRSAARWTEAAHFRAADLGFRLARDA